MSWKQGQLCVCDLGCSSEAWLIWWFVSFTSWVHTFPGNVFLRWRKFPS